LRDTGELSFKIVLLAKYIQTDSINAEVDKMMDKLDEIMDELNIVDVEKT